MSRSLVGSSSTSTLAGSASRRASRTRLRSPPESVRTGELARSGENRKSVEVAHHVLPAARRLDPLAARADAVGERRVEVERAAHLVEVGDLDARALAHRARGRLQLAEDQLQQRRLAGAVRADQADLVAAQDRRGEVLDDRALSPTPRVEAHRHVLQLGDDLAARHARVGLEADPAERLAPRRALRAQRLQPLRRGRRCACAAPRRPCAPRPPPAPAACRRARWPAPRRRAARPSCAPRRRRSCPG